MNQATIDKFTAIERALVRIQDVYQIAQLDFDTDYTSQDSITLNLQRACEASIDVANIINKQHRTGIRKEVRGLLKGCFIFE
jgi:uncharacterized protein YutE (UPF0331/DUF86 family)